ncbi:unnamed protein product [Linum trigynum]|uniref:Uncharacterized protein n=1 Tax=Linum trigynum TaxID=586398 RepID=A0AAV2EVP6_9ROSI
MSPIDQSGRRRRRPTTGGIINKTCYVIDILLSMDPPPFRLLLILAAIILCLPLPWRSSSSNRGPGPAAATTTGMGGWLLPATPIALVFLLHLFSTTTTYSIAAATRKSLLPCWLSSEGISPWAVAVLILQLVLMAQYRPSFHHHWPFN